MIKISNAALSLYDGMLILATKMTGATYYVQSKTVAAEVTATLHYRKVVWRSKWLDFQNQMTSPDVSLVVSEHTDWSCPQWLCAAVIRQVLAFPLTTARDIISRRRKHDDRHFIYLQLLHKHQTKSVYNIHAHLTALLPGLPGWARESESQ